MSKTKTALWDSLFGRPVVKSALMAYVQLINKANECGSTAFQLRQSYICRADKIAKRFRIMDLVLQWRNAI